MLNFFFRGVLGAQQQRMYFVSIVSKTEKDRFGRPLCIKIEDVWAFTPAEARKKGARKLGVVDAQEIEALEVMIDGNPVQ